MPARSVTGQFAVGQILAMIVIAIFAVAFAPLIILFIIWVRLADRLRRRQP